MNAPSISDIDRELFYRKYERESITAVNAEPFEFTGAGYCKTKIPPTRISIIPKLRPLFDGTKYADVEYFLLKGGRGSGKSESIASLLVHISRRESTRILCTREIQNTIKDSVKKVIEDWIDFLGYRDEYHITDNTIKHMLTGTEFLFMGLQSGTRQDAMKSLKGVKYVWVEEAQTLSKESWEKLDPTIRIDGRKILFSYNPRTMLDTTVEIEGLRKAVTIHINYNENPFLPRVLLDQAREMMVYDYDRYLHVWEGVPMADDATSIILPYTWLKKCVDLHKEYGFHDGKRFAGFDIADGVTVKHDQNALVTRSGPAVLYMEEWQVDEVYKSVNRVHQRYFQHGFETVAFDGTAIGIAAKSEYARIRQQEKKVIPYETYPFMGGASPEGKDVVFVKHGPKVITNGQYFKNLKAQGWWNLRLRLENSMKLINGKDIDRPEYYFSISSDIQDIERYFSELSQATYTTDGAGRIIVDKCPGISEIKVDGKTKKIRSPNKGDATIYAYSNDFIKSGLRAEGQTVIETDPEEEYFEVSTSWEAM